VLLQGDVHSRAGSWWRHWLTLDRVLVAVALLGIVIALVVAMWPGV
jgi:hypothetical protein